MRHEGNGPKNCRGAVVDLFMTVHVKVKVCDISHASAAIWNLINRLFVGEIPEDGPEGKKVALRADFMILACSRNV